MRSAGKKRCSFLRKKSKHAGPAAGSPSRGASASAAYTHTHTQHKVSVGTSSLSPAVTWPVVVGAGAAAVGRGVSEELIVPRELDLMALPQLCFPGGPFSLQLSHQACDFQRLPAHRSKYVSVFLD